MLVNGLLNGYSRIVELEAYEQGTAAPPPPTSRVNVALAANGGVATSSSVYANGYGGSGASTGTGAEPRGVSAVGGLMALQRFPDWLRVISQARKRSMKSTCSPCRIIMELQSSYQRHDFCPLWID